MARTSMHMHMHMGMGTCMDMSMDMRMDVCENGYGVTSDLNNTH